MEHRIKSYTIVPSDYYIERSADKQIVNIIDDMGRPGYVLVARQMGKTNLLLHTKEKLQDDKNIFVYLDFSVIKISNDKAFFELLIDKAIEEGKNVFQDAKVKIDALRKEGHYDYINQYTAELIILLDAVDKIVFVLDEIDALTRTAYSDNIFSQIRSDYFQRVNYPELNRITYILSGVVEPKDLIKDPNISPFNIGEKIYLRSFSRKESDELINRLRLSFSEEVKERLYYWTNGHPRMLNDLCHDLQYEVDPTTEIVDETVFHSYLESFDKAPIDGIRRNVENDNYLRDCIIQLYYGAEKLPIDVRQKLYLAGVGDYSGIKFIIKNPIIKEALPIEWLHSLADKENDLLRNIEELVFFKKNYSEAKSQLLRYISIENNDKLKLNDAYYYLGVCYFRTYETEESQRYLDKISYDETPAGIKTSLNALLIKGYNYSNMSMPKECIDCYDTILAKKDFIDEDVYMRAYIGKVDALCQGNQEEVTYAKKLINNILESNNTDSYYSYRAVLYYESCIAEDRSGNTKKALECIEEAIQYADDNEMPTLLYYKLILSENEEVSDAIISELVSYLKLLDKKPEYEDFDKMLSLNYFTLSCILVQIILYHESRLQEFAQYFKWFNDTKEAAYNSIMKHLRNYQEEHALPLAQKILELNKKDGWLFGTDHIFNAYSTIYWYKPNLENALVLYNYIEKNNYTDSRKEVAKALTSVAKEFIVTEKYSKAKSLIDFFRNQFSDTNDTLVNALSIIIDYYEAVLYIRNKDVDNARLYSERFINRVENLTQDEFDLIKPMKRDDIVKLCSDVKVSLMMLIDETTLKVPFVKPDSYSRNEWVLVEYLSDGHRVSKKYKKVAEDIKLGLCKIVENK